MKAILATVRRVVYVLALFGLVFVGQQTERYFNPPQRPLGDVMGEINASSTPMYEVNALRKLPGGSYTTPANHGYVMWRMGDSELVPERVRDTEVKDVTEVKAAFMIQHIRTWPSLFESEEVFRAYLNGQLTDGQRARLEEGHEVYMFDMPATEWRVQVLSAKAARKISAYPEMQAFDSLTTTTNKVEAGDVMVTHTIEPTHNAADGRKAANFLKVTFNEVYKRAYADRIFRWVPVKDPVSYEPDIYFNAPMNKKEVDRMMDAVLDGLVKEPELDLPNDDDKKDQHL